VLEVDDLRKAYRDRVILDGVSLSAPAGRVTGLVGANGAGKTTLISIAAGLRRPDAGRVRVAGIDARREPRRAARQIGLAQLGAAAAGLAGVDVAPASLENAYLAITGAPLREELTHA